MTIEEFAIWLSESRLSIALTDSELAFPALESLHVIALTLVVGSIALIDLRLIGLTQKKRDAAELIRSILPITWIAFGVAALSGLLLFTANPISYSANFYFLGKLALLGVAGLNMILFHLFSRRQLTVQGALTPRLSGAASLTLWLAVVTFGRWIGFTL